MCDCSGNAGVLVCSLKRDTPQLIEPGGYRIVRFPFGGGESYDTYSMHQTSQPDAFVIDSDGWDDDDRSGLIWPTRHGWGTLHALIQWGGTPDASEYRDQFVRDPLGLFSPPDTTATDHRAPTPGGQFWTKTHGIFVHPGVPLALRVAHNAPGPLALTLAEFKLVIHLAA
ncbi:hypothetical protein [Streptomyces sp. NPDC059063]|uniref:hypothetical protein n=1 Tax=Streptomyces sp. NPDC059063 TaxID=3346712 RepID=UPI003696E0F6